MRPNAPLMRNASRRFPNASRFAWPLRRKMLPQLVVRCWPRKARQNGPFNFRWRRTESNGFPSHGTSRAPAGLALVVFAEISYITNSNARRRFQAGILEDLDSCNIGHTAASGPFRPP